jgi:hypothetical protein
LNMRALPDLYSKFVELVKYLVCITYTFLTQSTGALPLAYKENWAWKPNTCIVNLRKISKNPNIRSMAKTANPNPTRCKSSLQRSN